MAGPARPVREPPATPCPFDDEFVADLPYEPEVLLFDRLLELDPERSLVRCRMDTSPPLPLTSQQRVDPVRHPRHLAAGLIMHATGMLGLVHAHYVLGLRHRDGWTGYGTHVHRAVFRRLVPPCVPAEATCVATRLRLGARAPLHPLLLRVRQRRRAVLRGRPERGVDARRRSLTGSHRDP